MSKPSRDSGTQKTTSGGRQLLGQWLQQKIEAGEDFEILPRDVAEASTVEVRKRPGSAKAVSTDLPSTSQKRKPVAESLFDGPADVAADPEDSLQRIAAEVNACTLCRLHETRDKSVPGVGPDDADLVFIGEGPGADEDRQGEPFVGRAGQLLTKIIASVELGREEVFITNIVKCRPPNNRDPRPDEIEACEPYLKRQLRVLDPKVICTLGRHAAMTLLQTKESMAKLRTGERSYEGVRLFPTYHPAALLRNPQWKRPVWEDIQKVRQAYDEPREKT